MQEFTQLKNFIFKMVKSINPKTILIVSPSDDRRGKIYSRFKDKLKELHPPTTTQIIIGDQTEEMQVGGFWLMWSES